MKDDTISRAAALDALGEEPLVWCDGEDEIAERDQWRRDVAAIKALPSAQPEKRTETHACDCIERQAVLDAVDSVDWYHQNKNGEMVHGANSDEHQAWYKADEVYTAIESVLSAQPERPKGEWIYGEHDIAMCDGYWCDQCGFFVPWDYKHKSIDFIKDYHWCPSCGADMRGEKDE